MISPRHLAFAALAIGVMAFAFLAGRVTDGGNSGAESEAGTGSERGSRPVAGSHGFDSRRRPSKSSGSRPGRAGDPGRGNQIPGSEKRGRGGKNQVPGSEGEDGGPLEWTAHDSSGKAGPARKLFENKGVALFNEDYQLSGEIKEVLRLGDSEYEAVTETLKESLDKIDTLREQSMEVRSRSASQLFLKIRSFGEKGAEVREALQNDLREQLGEERYSAFMLMTEDSLNSEYFEFGRAYQTISFNFYNSQNTGTRRIRVVDEVHIPQGDGQWTIIRKKGNHDSLPEDYQTYLDLANASGPARPAAANPSLPAPNPSPAASDPSPPPASKPQSPN